MGAETDVRQATACLHPARMLCLLAERYAASAAERRIGRQPLSSLEVQELAHLAARLEELGARAERRLASLRGVFDDAEGEE
jgi:hypothetical protein